MESRNTRRPCRAGGFYPASRAAVEEMLDEMSKAAPRADLGSAKAVAAIAPHAGWIYSGPTAYAAIKALLDHSEPETVVIFGAVHTWCVGAPTITEADEWLTPLGPLPVDTDLRDALLGAGLPVEADDHAHAGEHSIEVLLPIIQALSGAVKILPISAPPVSETIQIGQAVAKAADGKAVAVASTDLTHYGADYYGWAPKGAGPAALQWVKEKNDRSIIDAMLAMKVDEIMPTAARDKSACGAGAVAAAAAFAKQAGASRGHLVHYTTSYDVHPDGEPTDFVGYAGIVYTT